MAKCASTSLTHNDFFPALVGEQTLTRSVILHNIYQENKFYYRDSFFRKSAMGYVCPQWPDRCCFCFTKRLGVIATGLAFCVLDLLVIFLCGYTLFFNSNMWDKGKQALCFSYF